MSIHDNGMYDSLRPHVYKLERFDENVFDIFIDYLQFYSCNTPWQIPVVWKFRDTYHEEVTNVQI